jgi:hypothetical protein
MKSLDLKDFYIRYRKDVKLRDGSQYSVYFRDNADEIHVHPTMIVARGEFEGSDRTISSKYRQYPHIAQLSGWISKDDTARPTCPNCFLQLPLVGLCGRCEFDINDFRDE